MDKNNLLFREKPHDWVRAAFSLPSGCILLGRQNMCAEDKSFSIVRNMAIVQASSYPTIRSVNQRFIVFDMTCGYFATLFTAVGNIA